MIFSLVILTYPFPNCHPERSRDVREAKVEAQSKDPYKLQCPSASQGIPTKKSVIPTIASEVEEPALDLGQPPQIPLPISPAPV